MKRVRVRRPRLIAELTLDLVWKEGREGEGYNFIILKIFIQSLDIQSFTYTFNPNANAVIIFTFL